MRGWSVWVMAGLVLVAGVMIVVAPVAASQQNSAAQGVAQDGPTSFPTNTPLTSDLPAPTPTIDPATLPEATPTSAAPTPQPTATDVPVAENTLAPLATPTVLYPLNPEEGLVSNGTAVPTRMPLFVPRDREGGEYEILNFLLLGKDSESIDQREGVFRTDTMIVLSVNLTTDTVSMLSLPRDMFVYIPGWGMQRLNLAWGRGQSVGWTDGGFGLLRQTILYNFGIRIHYYAMVDFSGFKEIIDTLGGVTIAVDCPIEGTIFTEEYDENGDPIFEETVIPVGVHDMNSTEALFYARSRTNSTDFDRGRRQQQLLRAIWQKGKAGGWLNDIPTLYEQMTSVVETNVPLDVIVRLAPLALTIEPNEIENHFFRLGYETRSWTPPDGANVQLPNLAIINTIRDAFLTPPTQNRLVIEDARIAIYDNSGTGLQWDVVAAERLLWDGLLAWSMGEGAPSAELEGNGGTVIIDYTGETKGSSVEALQSLLNVSPENIFVAPDANREFDVAVYLSPGYSSCVERDVRVSTSQ